MSKITDIYIYTILEIFVENFARLELVIFKIFNFIKGIEASRVEKIPSMESNQDHWLLDNALPLSYVDVSSLYNQ